MSSPDAYSRKRARISDPGASAPLSRPVLAELLKSFSQEEILNLLLDSAARDPQVSADVQATFEKRKKAESERSRDFDHFSKSIWKDLNVTYDRASGRRQYDAGYEVCADIESTFYTIAKETPAYATSGTKLSALETMRKILKSLVLSQGEVPKVARNNFYSIEEMIAVAKTFNKEEAGMARRRGLVARLEELRGLQADYLEVWDVQNVIDIVRQAIASVLADTSWPRRRPKQPDCPAVLKQNHSSPGTRTRARGQYRIWSNDYTFTHLCFWFCNLLSIQCSRLGSAFSYRRCSPRRLHRHRLRRGRRHRPCRHRRLQGRRCHRHRRRRRRGLHHPRHRPWCGPRPCGANPTPCRGGGGCGRPRRSRRRGRCASPGSCPGRSAGFRFPRRCRRHRCCSGCRSGYPGHRGRCRSGSREAGRLGVSGGYWSGLTGSK